MKLRLEENSVRFRLSEAELDELANNGRVESVTEILSEETRLPEGRFIYAVACTKNAEPETCLIQPSYILVLLHAKTIDALQQDPGAPVFIRREVQLHDGARHRFMAYVEVDKPMKHKKRHENWLDTGQADTSRE
ncbi:MAG: hypothetical protein HYV27_13500 [Candidatus Hydrogenedentes bacterium]|nr:hypothetical protein [Candidatus Hydrogenedentota bacterium]